MGDVTPERSLTPTPGSPEVAPGAAPRRGRPGPCAGPEGTCGRAPAAACGPSRRPHPQGTPADVLYKGTITRIIGEDSPSRLDRGREDGLPKGHVIYEGKKGHILSYEGEFRPHPCGCSREGRPGTRGGVFGPGGGGGTRPQLGDVVAFPGLPEAQGGTEAPSPAPAAHAVRSGRPHVGGQVVRSRLTPHLALHPRALLQAPSAALPSGSRSHVRGDLQGRS